MSVAHEMNLKVYPAGSADGGMSTVALGALAPSIGTLLVELKGTTRIDDEGDPILETTITLSNLSGHDDALEAIADFADTLKRFATSPEIIAQHAQVIAQVKREEQAGDLAEAVEKEQARTDV